MKRLLATLSVIFACCVSCDNMDNISMAEVQQYQDSVSGLIPGARTVQARTERDFNTEAVQLKLIIGSEEFYDASPDKKQAAAIKAGQMALRILGKGLGSGVLIITKDIREHKEDPADGRASDMMIDSLKRNMPAQ